MVLVGDGLVVTPHILTETDNLCDHIGDPYRTKFRSVLKILAGKAQELCTDSRVIMDRSEFLYLGLCDAALIKLAEEGIIIISADGPMCAAAWKIAQNVILFVRNEK